MNTNNVTRVIDKLPILDKTKKGAVILVQLGGAYIFLRFVGLILPMIANAMKQMEEEGTL